MTGRCDPHGPNPQPNLQSLWVVVLLAVFRPRQNPQLPLALVLQVQGPPRDSSVISLHPVGPLHIIGASSFGHPGIHRRARANAGGIVHLASQAWSAMIMAACLIPNACGLGTTSTLRPTRPKTMYGVAQYSHKEDSHSQQTFFLPQDSISKGLALRRKFLGGGLSSCARSTRILVTVLSFQYYEERMSFIVGHSYPVLMMPARLLHLSSFPGVSWPILPDKMSGRGPQTPPG